MGERLKGKVAVVTGGGRGIGRAEALGLAAEGAKVVINDLGGAENGTGASTSPADEVVAEIKKMGRIAVANYDTVATAEGGERVIKTAIDNFGRLDILVNNAGNFRPRMVFNMPEEDWDSVVKVHLYGHFHCTKPACAWFRQQRSGRIINTSSEAGAFGGAGASNYIAAKEGIVGFTRAVAQEMGKYGVTCNCIRPRASTRMALKGDPHIAESFEKLQSEDIAPLVLYLATDEAANINGCVFLVCGGIISLFAEPTLIKTVYKGGRWEVDELCAIMPQTIAQGLINPAPPQPLKA